MMRFTRRIPVWLLSALLLASCARVPITGRSQFVLVGAGEVNKLSFDAYQDFMKKNKVSTNAEQTAMVKRVGSRIATAVEEFCARENCADRLAGFAWEFNLVESKDVNAWCMPGGKVVIYTGILPVAQTEAGLAVVMGHEIAHAIAHHGAERMTQNLATQYGLAIVDGALEGQTENTRALVKVVAGAGAQLGVLLPFSRVHESEADRLGVTFMAMAGYDPREAPRFWQRMTEKSQGGQPLEFLSTHPSHATRIADLTRWAEEAVPHYEAAKP